MERTAMSRKEFARGSVLARVTGEEITLRDAVPLRELHFRIGPLGSRTNIITG